MLPASMGFTGNWICHANSPVIVTKLFKYLTPLNYSADIVSAELNAHVKGIVDSVINIFFVFSIVIDSNRGNCYQHLKKKMMKIEPVTCIWMFVCVMNFWAARNDKKWSFLLFRPNLRELGLFRPYFVCECSFREISMIKMVILDQSEPILLILKIEK